MSRNIYKTYFSHDIYSRQDQKIKNMLVHFRKESNMKAQAACCIFWWIVEDMHADDYPIDKIDVFADDYRCDVEFLKSILEDFGLFKIENGCYISDRVLKNIAEQEEKSEKAKKKAAKRWNNRPKTPEEIQFDTDFVNQVITIYNTEFKKTQIVSNENRQRIDELSKSNKITLEIWQQVFENARRGWDFQDGKNKQPNLKTILDKWDLFASGDYYLAPDREKIKRNKEAAEREKAIQEEADRIQREKDQAEYEAERAAICDAESAIAFLNKRVPFPPNMLARSSMFKEYQELYGITCEDVISAREKK